MPRGRPKSINEATIIARAMRLLWREGVRGISLNELARQLGVSKPALVRAFGGKDELIAEALRRYYQMSGVEAEMVIERATSLEDLIKTYLAVYVRAHTMEDEPPGCLLASATNECSTVTSGPVRETLNDLSQRAFGVLQNKLANFGVTDSAAVARFLVGQTLAMSAMARNGASRNDLQKMADLAAPGVLQAAKEPA